MGDEAIPFRSLFVIEALARFVQLHEAKGSGMNVQELVLRFPEIKPDLHDEPLLAEFTEAFGDLLQVAQNPSNCSAGYEPGHHYYLKLIGPIKLYMYGLSSREKVLGQIQELLDGYQADPSGFASSLLPSDAPA